MVWSLLLGYLHKSAGVEVMNRIASLSIDDTDGSVHSVGSLLLLRPETPIVPSTTSFFISTMADVTIPIPIPSPTKLWQPTAAITSGVYTGVKASCPNSNHRGYRPETTSPDHCMHTPYNITSTCTAIFSTSPNAIYFLQTTSQGSSPISWDPLIAAPPSLYSQ